MICFKHTLHLDNLYFVPNKNLKYQGLKELKINETWNELTC